MFKKCIAMSEFSIIPIVPQLLSLNHIHKSMLLIKTNKQTNKQENRLLFISLV